MWFDLDKMYCGLIKRGDVFLCGRKGAEKNVVVLQDDTLNESLSTVVCAALKPCKKGQEVLPYEVKLKSTEIGMKKDAICNLSEICTVDRRLMYAKKAELKSKKIQELLKALDMGMGRFRDIF